MNIKHNYITALYSDASPNY